MFYFSNSQLKGLNGLESTDWVLENADVMCINPPKGHWKWKRLNNLPYTVPIESNKLIDSNRDLTSVPLPITDSICEFSSQLSVFDVDTVKSLETHITTLTSDQVRSLISDSLRTSASSACSSTLLVNETVGLAQTVNFSVEPEPPVKSKSSQMSRQQIEDQMNYWQKVLEERDQEIIANDNEIIKIIDDLNSLNETGSSGIFDETIPSP